MNSNKVKPRLQLDLEERKLDDRNKSSGLHITTNIHVL